MTMIQIVLKCFKTLKYLNVYHQHVGDKKLVDTLMDISAIEKARKFICKCMS